MKTDNKDNVLQYGGLLILPVITYLLLHQIGLSWTTLAVLSVGLLLTPVVTMMLLSKTTDKKPIETSIILLWMTLMFVAIIQGVLGPLVWNVNPDIIHPILLFSMWKMPLISLIAIILLHVISIKQYSYTTTLSIPTVLIVMVHLIYSVLLIIVLFANFSIVD